MTRAVVATEGFVWLKEDGYPLASWDRVPEEAAKNPENWEIVGEIYVDETHFCEFENKMEYGGTTTYLIAPLKETEKPEFFHFEDEAEALGFSEYAA